jgi:hypothetical protein
MTPSFKGFIAMISAGVFPASFSFSPYGYEFLIVSSYHDNRRFVTNNTFTFDIYKGVRCPEVYGKII